MNKEALNMRIDHDAHDQKNIDKHSEDTIFFIMNKNCWHVQQHHCLDQIQTNIDEMIFGIYCHELSDVDLLNPEIHWNEYYAHKVIEFRT